MTEEKVEKKPAEKPEEKPDKIAELAMKLGWNPDHEDDDRPFVSAEEYILKSREIQNTASKQLRAQRRETNDLKAGLEALKNHNEAVYKVHIQGLNKEVRRLKKERKEADEDGDTSLVQELDKEIKDIEKIPKEVPIQETKISPAFREWLKKNDWYETDDDMRQYADAQSYDKKLVGLPETKIYAELRKRTKEMFPDKFSEKKKSTPPAATVEGSSTQKKKPKVKKFTFNDLNEDQQKMAKFFEARGAKKIEDYIQELADIGQLK
jgi:hypothetical protein